MWGACLLCLPATLRLWEPAMHGRKTRYVLIKEWNLESGYTRAQWLACAVPSSSFPESRGVYDGWRRSKRGAPSLAGHATRRVESSTTARQLASIAAVGQCARQTRHYQRDHPTANGSLPMDTSGHSHIRACTEASALQQAQCHGSVLVVAESRSTIEHAGSRVNHEVQHGTSS